MASSEASGYVAGEDRLLLSDDRKITKQRSWVAILVTVAVLGALIFQPAPDGNATVAYRAGQLIAASGVYWLCLRLLSKPVN